MKVWRLVAIGLVFAIVAGPASAQTTAATASIVGTVVDAQGGVVTDAALVVIGETRRLQYPGVTSKTGDFVVSDLPDGRYRLEIRKRGFRTLVRPGLMVAGGDRLSLDTLVLHVAAALESVDVRAEEAPAQQAGGRGEVIDTNQLDNLPILSRNLQDFLALVPGVNGTSRIGGGGQDSYTIDGMSALDTGSNALMGGLNLNIAAISEIRVLTAGYQAEYGRSSGMQIQATTRSGTNQFRWSTFQSGRNSSLSSNSWANSQNGVRQSVSRSAAFGFTLGGPVGRSGGDNNLFFFYSQELRPAVAGRNTSFFRLPTALERRGDFSETVDQNGKLENRIYDAASALPKSACSATETAACFQDGGVLGRIPLSRLYGPGLALLNQYPLPNAAPADGRSYNYTVATPINFTLTYTPVVRLDYVPASHVRLSGKWLGQNALVERTAGSLPGFNDTIQKYPLAFSTSGTLTYARGTSVIEATYGVTQNRLGAPPVSSHTNRDSVVCPPDLSAAISRCTLGDMAFLYPDAGTIDPRYYEYEALQDIGVPFLRGGQTRLPPQLSWGAAGTTSRISGAPPSLNFPAFMNINRVQDVNVSATRVMGRHTAKAGFYLQHSYKAQNLSGSVNFQGLLNLGNDGNNPLDSGFPFANAALGVFSSYTQQSRFLEGRFVYDNVEWYLQDHWRPTSKLTLNYGLRFVHQTPQADEFGQGANFFADRWTPAGAPLLYLPGCANVSPCRGEDRQARDPRTGALLGPASSSLIGQAIAGTGNPANGMVRAGDGISEAGYRWPWLGLAPRIGAAYDARGRGEFVLRGSVGLFFDRPDGNSVFGTIGNPPVATGSVQQWGRLTDLGQAGSLTFSGVPSVRAYYYDSKLPSDAQWNAGAQVAMPWRSTMNVSYVGHHAFNVLGGQQAGSPVDLNTIDLGAALAPSGQDSTQDAGTALPATLLRPYRGYSNILMQWGRFHRTFHSIQTSFNRRFYNGLSAGLNWTYSISDRGTTSRPAPMLRLDHFQDGSYAVRDDQARAEALFGDQGRLNHLVVANFVWTLPSLRTDRKVPKAIRWAANGWQMSGIFRFDTGTPYDVTYSYQTGGGIRLTGSPDYNARVVVSGDPGSGCSDNQYRQFNTDAFRGPLPGSDGLESGRFLLRGCGDHRLDLAFTRQIRLRGSLYVQVRLEAYNVLNAVIYNGRSSTMQMVGPAEQRILNAQYLADGTVDPGRLQPNQAGFGAATSALGSRTIQIQAKLKF